MGLVGSRRSVLRLSSENHLGKLFVLFSEFGYPCTNGILAFSRFSNELIWHAEDR